MQVASNTKPMAQAKGMSAKFEVENHKVPKKSTKDSIILKGLNCLAFPESRLTEDIK
jgi:hypothetical protein